MKTVVVVLWLLLSSPWQQSLAAQLNFFRRVPVSWATLSASHTQEFVAIDTDVVLSIVCSTLCLRRPWCHLWSRPPSRENECFLSDMFVMPDYVEPNPGDAVAAFTSRPKDYVSGADIKGTATNPGEVPREKENLVDGIYDQWNKDQCYFLDSDAPIYWFRLDFGIPVTFSTVRMYGLPNGGLGALGQINNLEVLTGMTDMMADGDFSSFAFFGSFDGPATEFKLEIVIEVPDPVTARFLAVQKPINERFMICHVEVF